VKSPPSSPAQRVARSSLPTLDELDTEPTGRFHRGEVPGSLAQQPVRPVLAIVEGADAGRIVAIEGREVVIGRAVSCNVVLPDGGVSRRHARVTVHGRDFHLEDLGSKNGTFVAGRPIVAHTLGVGEAFHVGPNVRLRVSMMDPIEERLARQLYDSSMRDVLTGAFNRRYFYQRLGGELAFAVRHRTEVSVLMLDLDHFKRLNDTLGHAAGDRVLQEVTKVIARTLRSEDVLARLGGEEFVVILRGTAQADAITVAERIRVAVAGSTFALGEHDLRVSVSAGVSTSSELGQASTVETLLTLADRRLYEAKDAGRNSVRGADLARRPRSS
jgi:two-component system cell cycle response regulator